MSDNEAMIHFLCPHCNHPLKTKAKNKGRQFQCVECDHLVNVPSDDGQSEHGQTWQTHVARECKEESTTKKRGHR